MKGVSNQTFTAWQSGDYTGTRRPMARVTVEKLKIALTQYDVRVPLNDSADRTGKVASAYFGQINRPQELPNLKSVRWSRSNEEAVGTATFEFYNTAPLPLGETPSSTYEFDQPGYYTFNRGKTPHSNAFGHTRNGWQDLLVPDRVLKSYEGYGFDPQAPPEDDLHMYPSGTWLIDTVQYTAEGMITVECRDFGRLLVDHICFPPVIPWAEYPIYWDAYHQVKDPDTTVVSDTTAWVTPGYHSDSNIAWVGGSSLHGHHGRDAFDANPDSYFLSVGNVNPREPFAYEYVQGTVGGATVSGLRTHVYAGPYTVYASVFADGKWHGAQTIPYARAGIGRNTTNIPFVASTTVGANGQVDLFFPAIANVQFVRITLGNLWNSGIGPYVYRGAQRTVQALTGQRVTTVVPGQYRQVGNYGDYTEIVKWFLAWGGFYWPARSEPVFPQTGQSFFTTVQGTKKYRFYLGDGDPIFGGKGRIWGDLEMSGVANKIIDGISVKLDIDIFDKKPLLDCIEYIRDILGFNFYIDERGGAIFRSQNIWAVGSWIWNNLGQSRPNRNSTPRVLDEKTVLTGLTVAMSSRNVRERVFVANLAGNLAGISGGYNPYPSGMRRVGGWTDQRFASSEECQRMADLITLRQMMTYRENQVTISGFPGIQVDDQVRIKESVTEEGYIHLVKTIDSEWDIESGEWTYRLTTSWLGESPFDRWVFDPYDPDQLSANTLEYLRAAGLVP